MVVNKFALCFGINEYSNPNAQLSGCVNDAQDWAKFLAARGYGTRTYLNESVNRENFRRVLTDTIDAMGYRDRLVVTYSGHGSWVPDNSGDEPDHRDEVIVMQDMTYITDDELKDLFARRAWGTRCAFISDSCHSGSVTRFVGNGPKTRFVSPLLLEGVASARVALAEPLPKRALTTSDAVLLSGSADDEYSYDAWYGTRPNGALTRTAIDAYAPGLSWKDWHARIRKILPSTKYPQTPQLVATYRQARTAI